MIAFFLTMPISSRTPIAAMTLNWVSNSPQRERRADAGREQRRQDGDRMDQALIEYAEHDIDRQERCAEEQRHARLRLLKSGRRSGERATDGRGHADAFDRLVDLRLGFAERSARRQIERIVVAAN